jgi:hypothetical protein
MIPKEKAKQLVNRLVKLTYSVNKFNYITELEHDAAKQCALICVNEILNELGEFISAYNYWQDVEQEINKL